jgi:Flp pilus assembly protein CpaB
MPPALQFIIIIGLAVMVTMMITHQSAKLVQVAEIDYTSPYSAESPRAPVMVSVAKIPEGTTITNTMVSRHRLKEKTIWDDALTTQPDVVGRVAKHSIPANNQIREQDLR